MRLMFAALAAAMAATAAVRAHALSIVPAADNGGGLTVVFSDDLTPDPKVKAESWKKMAGLKLLARAADGTNAAVTWTQAEHKMTATAPAGTRVVYGRVDYGVSTKHVPKPTRVTFYPKAVVGPVAADGGAVGAELEVVPVSAGGSLRFRVLAAGTPVVAATVSVAAPGKADKSEATTDDQGLTPAFTGTGRYGVTVRRVEPTAGEFNGEKYEQVSRVATLVVDVK